MEIRRSDSRSFRQYRVSPLAQRVRAYRLVVCQENEKTLQTAAVRFDSCLRFSLTFEVRKKRIHAFPAHYRENSVFFPGNRKARPFQITPCLHVHPLPIGSIQRNNGSVVYIQATKNFRLKILSYHTAVCQEEKAIFSIFLLRSEKRYENQAGNCQITLSQLILCAVLRLSFF